jgi:hypothetical protein
MPAPRIVVAKEGASASPRGDVLAWVVGVPVVWFLLGFTVTAVYVNPLLPLFALWGLLAISTFILGRPYGQGLRIFRWITLAGLALVVIGQAGAAMQTVPQAALDPAELVLVLGDTQPAEEGAAKGDVPWRAEKVHWRRGWERTFEVGAFEIGSMADVYASDEDAAKALQLSIETVDEAQIEGVNPWTTVDYLDSELGNGAKLWLSSPMGTAVLIWRSGNVVSELSVQGPAGENAGDVSVMRSTLIDHATTLDSRIRQEAREIEGD